MSDPKPSKRVPSWWVIKTVRRVGTLLDVYLAHDSSLTSDLSGAARFPTFHAAAQRLHTFQTNSNEDDRTKWSARVVGLLTKSGEP